MHWSNNSLTPRGIVDLKPLLVLGRSRFQANDDGVGVNLLHAHFQEERMPSTVRAPDFKYGQHPKTDPAASFFQAKASCGLDKARLDIVFFEHRKIRDELDFRWSAFRCQMEHPLKSSQSAIDSSVRYASLLGASRCNVCIELL
jgi:hypothetical protein